MSKKRLGSLKKKKWNWQIPSQFNQKKEKNQVNKIKYDKVEVTMDSSRVYYEKKNILTKSWKSVFKKVYKFQHTKK